MNIDDKRNYLIQNGWQEQESWNSFNPIFWHPSISRITYLEVEEAYRCQLGLEREKNERYSYLS